MSTRHWATIGPRVPAGRSTAQHAYETPLALTMRGEICIGFASFFSFAAWVLLIFMHVGQINTSTIPRGIAMVKVNMSGYGQALATALGDPINGLYTQNATAPLQQRAGLRDVYEWGIYSFCAYTTDGLGSCSNHTIANRFSPFDTITGDMQTNYSTLTVDIISGTPTTFQSSSYLGSLSKSAYYLLLISTICAALAFVIGVIKNNWAFLFSTIFALLGSLMLLVGSSIWTVLIQKTESINSMVIGSASVPAGVLISTGNGPYLSWAAFACLTLSIIPYMISCCTFRG